MPLVRIRLFSLGVCWICFADRPASRPTDSLQRASPDIRLVYGPTLLDLCPPSQPTSVVISTPPESRHPAAAIPACAKPPSAGVSHRETNACQAARRLSVKCCVLFLPGRQL
eukprot:3939539-Rhodomonas_salina.1